MCASPRRADVPDRPSGPIPGITGEINYDDAHFAMPAALEPYKIPLLSYSSSLVSTAIGFPLDSVKTRMQTHRFGSALDCFRKTISNEGFRGLFRGIAAPLISTSCSRALSVSIFTMSKSPVSALMYPVWGSEPIVSSEAVQNKQLAGVLNNMPISFISGAIAGGTVSMFACPFELTKIFQQIVMLVNSETHSNLTSKKLPVRMVDVTRSIITQNGFRGLYAGYHYHLLRDSFSSGLFYGIYETVKMGLQSLSTRALHKGIISQQLKDNTDMLCVPLAGAFAGCFSWITVFPIDTVKAQYQRDIVGNIIRARSGLPPLPVVAKPLRLPTRDMYRGLGPSITRSILTTAIFFSLFEGLMKTIA